MNLEFGQVARDLAFSLLDLLRKWSDVIDIVKFGSAVVLTTTTNQETACAPLASASACS